MVNKVWKFLSADSKSVHEAAYLLATFTFISQLLALVRDRLFAGAFGADSALDTYYAAFRIPDLIFTTVASLVSVSVLVPFLIRLRDKNGDVAEKGGSEERDLLNSIFTVFVLLICIVVVLAWIFMPELLRLAVPGIDDAALLPMARLMLLSPLILGLSNLCGSIVQSKRRFLSYALSPVFYNLGIIIGVYFFYESFGLYGLALGVVLGSFMHLVIQIPSVIRHSIFPRFTTKINWTLVREVFSLSLPRTLTIGMNHLTIIALIGVASFMTVGSISIFTFASNLQSVPLALIGVSYSLAAFPVLSSLYAEGKREEFLEQLINPLKQVLFWSIPVTVMFIVLRAQIIRTILGTGEFDWNDTRLTAAACAIFVISICAQNISLLLTRGYYASGKTKRPFIFAFWGAVVSAVAVVAGIFYFAHNVQNDSMNFFWNFVEALFRVSGITGTEVLILPLAFSLGVIVQAILLWRSFAREYPGFTLRFERPIFQSLGASIIGGFVSYLMLNVLDDFFDLETTYGIFAQGFIAGIGGLLITAIILHLLHNHEIAVVFQTVRSKIWKAKPLTEDVHEVV